MGNPLTKLLVSLACFQGAFIAIFALGWGHAVIMGDPHILNRTGAVIAGLAALLVAVQYAYDLVWERIRKSEVDTQGSPERLLGPIRARLLDRLSREAASSEEQDHRLRRQIFVTMVAINACAGELVHGFGDLLMPALSVAHEETIGDAEAEGRTEPGNE